MTSTVLSITDLTKVYGSGPNRFDALKGVSLEIAKGKSVAIAAAVVVIAVLLP